MATTKNITMKQFNGTDYDTLYPKTKVEQVENLTPSSIGAVSKTGDTMTGNLQVPSLNVNQNVCLGYIYGTTNSLTLQGGNPTTGTLHRLYIKDSGVYVDDNLVCHEGNLQSVGAAQIATGSYVGTGHLGPNYPMSINVGFTPKLFWVGLKDYAAANGVMAGMMLDVGRQEENGLFIYPGTKFICSPNSTSHYYVTVTWGPTMSWSGGYYTDNTEHGEYQYNEAGVTYYWVAIG